MPNQYYAPLKPLDAIIFDCDGTLSHIEGIVELAQNNGVGEQVRELTEAAMGQVGMNPAIYQERLRLVMPTAEQVAHLGQTYYKNAAPDLVAVLQILQRLNKVIYIVSAGLYPSVVDFAQLLHIAPEAVFAVNISFDQRGHYLDFDRDSPLVHANGKELIVKQLRQKHREIMFVGDGLTDLVTRDHIARFVGYGGAFYRQNIADAAEFYISAPTMAPVLALSLTDEEKSLLKSDEQFYYEKGLMGLGVS